MLNELNEKSKDALRLMVQYRLLRTNLEKISWYTKYKLITEGRVNQYLQGKTCRRIMILKYDKRDYIKAYNDVVSRSNKIIDILHNRLDFLCPIDIAESGARSKGQLKEIDFYLKELSNITYTDKLDLNLLGYTLDKGYIDLQNFNESETTIPSNLEQYGTDIVKLVKENYERGIQLGDSRGAELYITLKYVDAYKDIIGEGYTHDVVLFHYFGLDL